MGKLQEMQERFSSLHVLYVEDEEDLREQTLIFLKKIFSHIDTACNGQDGLEKFKNGSYDLVITDLRMPKMDGREMLAQIHAIDESVVLIVMTASDSNIDATETVSDGYLHKPVMFTDFLELLESFTDRLSKE